MPITSPVDFISGPRMMSTPGKRLNGKTASFTQTCLGIMVSVKDSSPNVLPSMTRVASFASGTPMALLTKGTVRDARGLTSRTYSLPSLIAY
ncbi:MAG: hypothetical protein BWX45_00878 [Deltaproteobacteria bacterium ADurb.Bin002]|nr:MAG: hypothetical protein BWX45_00878 [Deltaproteobacteria bacterium ADurb.Bin002]